MRRLCREPARRDARLLSAVELILTGAIPLSAAPATRFTTRDGRNVTLPEVPPPPEGAALRVTLSAMQIRTFRCQVAYDA